MEQYTGIKVTVKTKLEFDKQRTLTQGKVSANDYLYYLLKKNK